MPRVLTLIKKAQDNDSSAIVETKTAINRIQKSMQRTVGNTEMVSTILFRIGIKPARIEICENFINKNPGR